MPEVRTAAKTESNPMIIACVCITLPKKARSQLEASGANYDAWT